LEEWTSLNRLASPQSIPDFTKEYGTLGNLP